MSTDAGSERPYPDITDIEAALGSLVIAFSEIEFRLQQLIWGLIGDADAGQIVTSAMPFRLTVSAAEQLWHSRVSKEVTASLSPPEVMDEVRRHDENAADVLDYIFKRARAAEEKRNQLLHSWWPDPSEPHWIRVPPVPLGDSTIRWKSDRRTGRLKPHKVPLAQIRETAAAFISTANDLGWMAGFAYGVNRDETAPAAKSEGVGE